MRRPVIPALALTVSGMLVAGGVLSQQLPREEPGRIPGGSGPTSTGVPGGVPGTPTTGAEVEPSLTAPDGSTAPPHITTLPRRPRASVPATPVPTTRPAGPAVEISEQRGVTLWAWWPDAYATPDSDAALARIASVGATWVVLVPTWFQQSTSSSTFGPKDTFTPTDDSIRHAVAAAKAVGLKVMLKPHIDVDDGTCRCAIRPADIDAWFGRYREMLLHYTELSVAAGIDQLAVGTELAEVSTEAGRWRSVIAAVRARYKGPVLYAALPVELPRISFWDALDAIGVDAYWRLSDQPTEDAHRLRLAWDPIVSELAVMAARWNRPIVFTEAGYASQRGTATDPGSWTMSTVPAPAEQAAAYNALLAAVPGRPWFRGVHWWAWRVTNMTDALDFTPQDKDAEQALRQAWGS